MYNRNLYNFLEKQLGYIEADLYYMEESDTAYTREYANLLKTKKIIVKTMKKLKRVEGTK